MEGGGSQTREGWVRPHRVTRQSQEPSVDGEIARVMGLAHLPTRPTSARSSRLRSTIVSPRILFTSGRSGSGTCSSTSSQSDGHSPGMARRAAPREAPGSDLPGQTLPARPGPAPAPRRSPPLPSTTLVPPAAGTLG